MLYLLKNVPRALEKKVYFSALGWNVLKIWMKSMSSNVSFKPYVSLLIFCFDDLSIGVSGVLNSPTIIVLLSISSFMSVNVCLWTAMLLCWVPKYLQALCLLLELIFWSLCSVLLYLLQSSLFLVYFIWNKSCHSSFLLISIWTQYHFPSFYFHYVYVSRSEVGLL